MNRASRALNDSDRQNTVLPGCRWSRSCGYRQGVSVAKLSFSIVVFSDVDDVLQAPLMPNFTAAARVLKQLAIDDTALVLCSGKTRAELEFIQQKLDIRHPFICENGGAAIIPEGYFDFALADTRSLAGYQAYEWGRTYVEVVDILHLTADRLGIQILGFSDMSIVDVARECELPLLQARLAKLRDYEERFRFIDTDSSARVRLFKALDAAGLQGRQGRDFDSVGSKVNRSAGVSLLAGLYRRARGDLATIGIADAIRHDNLLRLVDYAIMVPDTNPFIRRRAAVGGRGSDAPVDVVDWAEAIVARVEELRVSGLPSRKILSRRDG